MWEGRGESKEVLIYKQAEEEEGEEKRGWGGKSVVSQQEHGMGCGKTEASGGEQRQHISRMQLSAFFHLQVTFVLFGSDRAVYYVPHQHKPSRAISASRFVRDRIAAVLDVRGLRVPRAGRLTL
ncbi:hypothetical protein MUK42_36454 [Musa troglodytarum]|uniref:Uncharacterized protein n=1 Tax=Musa troglodytarum TaxID=320322 RepID=A0A9E7FG23_9LILI|nr:hypothetical protein MUK42_36454 [Musa troglodytarum]